jgi:hypothetical protein
MKRDYIIALRILGWGIVVAVLVAVILAGSQPLEWSFAPST